MRLLKIFFFLSSIVFPQQSNNIGDVDCNGVLNSEDASLILQYVTSVIDSLPCSNNINGLTPTQLQDIISMVNDVNIEVEDYITMIGPMYLYSECGLDCIQVDYVTGAEFSNELSYFEATLFCAKLEYEGYDDWRLPSLKGLIDWIYKNNQNILPIPNFPGETGYGNYFLSVDHNSSSEMVQVTIGNNSNMVGTNGSTWNGKCFCVR